MLNIITSFFQHNNNWIMLQHHWLSKTCSEIFLGWYVQELSVQRTMVLFTTIEQKISVFVAVSRSSNHRIQIIENIFVKYGIIRSVLSIRLFRCQRTQRIPQRSLILKLVVMQKWGYSGWSTSSIMNILFSGWCITIQKKKVWSSIFLLFRHFLC